MSTEVYQSVEKELREAAHLATAEQLLFWDEEVCMPEAAVEARAATVAYLSELLHDKRTKPEFVEQVKDLRSATDLTADQQVVIRETWRDLEREVRLPTEFVGKLSQVTARANSVWKEARAADDFSHFLPILSEIIELKRQEADYLGYQGSPYDALLDLYEPGLTTVQAAGVLAELKERLVPLLGRITASPVQPDPARLQGEFPVERQAQFSRQLAAGLGYDLKAGRIDTAAHPFAMGLHPTDVRITTRFDPADAWSAISSTIHETGHALYDQGLPAEWHGTPLGESISLGIHESQSRMWENLVGRSLPFWKYWYLKLQETFPAPFAGLPVEEFYRLINAVRPSLIRVEADEVTYNLHIVLRFELERALIEGELQPAELPAAWNARMREYLGLEVPTNSLGVLQDVHWSGGMIGYFPTYSLGNLYSAQFYAAASREISSLEEGFAKGEFAPLREWLREKIHSQGRRYSAAELVERVSGQPLSAEPFLDYLEKKYAALYQLA